MINRSEMKHEKIVAVENWVYRQILSGRSKQDVQSE